MTRRRATAISSLALIAAAALALLVTIAALALPAPALASDAHPTITQMEPLVMCPTCGTTLDRSQSPAANRVRDYIKGRIHAGWSKQQILDGVVREYGGDTSILAAPPKRGAAGLAAWGMPVALLLGALVAGVFMVRGWVRSGGRRTADDAVADAVAASAANAD